MKVQLFWGTQKDARTGHFVGIVEIFAQPAKTQVPHVLPTVETSRGFTSRQEALDTIRAMMNPRRVCEELDKFYSITRQ
jgi:hypothetical protein